MDRGPGNISEIKGLWRRVRDLEIQHEIRQIRKRIRELELQREMRKETESRYVIRDDVNEEEEFDEDEVYIDEGGRLFLEQALRWIPEGVPMARNDGSIFTFDNIERNEGEKGLVEGDGPTVVTGGPVASMATLPFVPKVQRKGDEASNGVMEPHANNDTVNFGLYVKNDFFNKIGLVDCGPQDQMGRKDYEGPTTTSLDVFNSL
nr:nucleotide-binding alpha-beta plait domain-containing protein [Tanacetum cinerariifolium]